MLLVSPSRRGATGMRAGRESPSSRASGETDNASAIFMSSLVFTERLPCSMFDIALGSIPRPGSQFLRLDP